MMDSLFFDNDNNNKIGFCMAGPADHEDDVWYPLNGPVEDYSSILSFSPPKYDDDQFAVAVNFQDYIYDQDLDITTTTTENNIPEYLMDPILDVETIRCTTTYDDDHHQQQQQPFISSDHGDADQLLGLIISHESMVTNDDDHATPFPPAAAAAVPSLVFFPGGAEEMDNEESVFHLLMAYIEAIEMGQEELSEVIGKRISDKVSPVGDTILERLMYYMFQTLDNNKNSDYSYLKQESLKNFFPAFGAFYQMFPNGKLAHLVANLAILEALPNDVSVIRIFDFDIGEGIQWASLIGATIINNSAKQSQIREVVLTSVKLIDSNDVDHPLVIPIPEFEDTKRRLLDYAMTYGVELKVEEIELRDLGMCLTSRGGRRRRDQWFVFNCMVGLPHMGRVRSRKNVVEFLESAQDFLQRYNNPGSGGGGGIVIVGEGDAAWEKVRNGANNYGEFFDGKMGHYHALLESIKHKFPIHLGEARTAMECLFVAPFVSSRRWAKEWEEMKKKKLYEEQEEEEKEERRWKMRLEGWKLSQERIMEAMELVRLEEESSSSSLYGVRLIMDEIVMDWGGVPMVKVSCWRSSKANG